MPATTKEILKNYWYYYKWAVFALLFLIVVLTICIKQCAARINYDLSVTVYTSTPVGENDIKKMSAYFEKVCYDVNGNGQVNVRIYDCSYIKNGNRQVQLAKNTKLQAILSSEYDAMLFITDDETLSYFESLEALNMPFNKTVVLSDNFYKECEADDLFLLPSGLKISRRVIADTAMMNNKKASACFEAAGKVLDAIK